MEDPFKQDPSGNYIFVLIILLGRYIPVSYLEGNYCCGHGQTLDDQNRLTKRALAHSFHLPLDANFHSTSGGLCIL